jgi:hypothetical protein
MKLNKKKVITLKSVINEIFLIDVDEDSRRRDVVDARRIYSKILRDEGCSFNSIGDSIGRDHATIMHYTKSIDSILTYDKNLRERYIACKEIYIEKRKSIFEEMKKDVDAYVTIVRLNNELHEAISLKNKILTKFVDSIEEFKNKNGYLPSVQDCRLKLLPLFNE